MVLPDILGNAGGVTVSYFEWVQGTQNLTWTLEEINRRLKEILLDAFQRKDYVDLGDHFAYDMPDHIAALKGFADALRKG